MTGPRGFAFVIACVSAGALLSGQQQAPTFKATVDVVPLFVSVTDADGTPIPDLHASDFSVLDNGNKVTLAGFAGPPQSFAVRLLVSHTSRMQRYDEGVRRATAALVGLMDAPDLMAIGTLAEPLSPFVSDRPTLEAASRELLGRKRGGGFDEMLGGGQWISIRNAINAGLERPTRPNTLWQIAWEPGGSFRWVDGSAPQVMALIVLSSGMDWSDPQFDQFFHPIVPQMQARRNDEVARNAIRSNVIVMGVGFDGRAHDKRLQGLSEQSSGWFLQPNGKTDWAVEMRKMVRDFRGRYLLGFVPSFLDGQDHTVKVEVTRKSARVRARTIFRAAAK